MQGKNKQKGLFVVRVWLNEADLSAMAQLAEKLGFRKVGLLLKTQKPHGFADEWRANTDGISRAYKYLYAYWSDTEPRRLKEATEAAAALQEAQRLVAEKKRGF